MLFTDPFFLCFFLPAVLLIYYAAPSRARNTILTLASIVFYAAGEWRFLGWLLASVAVNYGIGRGLAATRGRPWCKRLLIIGLTSDLALLGVFKYGGFAVWNLNRILGAAHLRLLPVPELLLPLGISFFTFHKISYKVDVYRGVAEARKAPFDLALYILLFPQLIAGPIVRYNEIAHELVRRAYRREDFAAGVRRFVLGLGRKMIVANPAGYCADQVFSLRGDALTAGLAWLGLLAYTVQIYFDFAGYSDMAIGLARMFGFHFPENFNYPYVSASITEFWRRWHMSLSRFLRDYLYIPLGGNRRGAVRVYLNLGIVFLLCGLWHGAKWNFVIWGALHGALLVAERLGLARLLMRLPRPLRHAYVLLSVMGGWVFFRSGTLKHALVYLAALLGKAQAPAGSENPLAYLNGELLIALTIGVIGSAPVAGLLGAARARLRERPAPFDGRVVRVSFAFAEAAGFAGVLIYSLMLAAADTYNPFIYFRF